MGEETPEQRAKRAVGYSFWLNSDGSTTAMSYREIVSLLHELDGSGRAYREFPHCGTIGGLGGCGGSTTDSLIGCPFAGG